jgi:hypothetical protein
MKTPQGIPVPICRGRYSGDPAFGLIPADRSAPPRPAGILALLERLTLGWRTRGGRVVLSSVVLFCGVPGRAAGRSRPAKAPPPSAAAAPRLATSGRPARHAAPRPPMGRHTRGLALHSAHGAPWTGKRPGAPCSAALTMGRHTRGLALHGERGAPWRRRGHAHRSAAAPRPVADRGIPSGGRSSGRDGPCSGRARLRPLPPDSSARAQRDREAL